MAYKRVRVIVYTHETVEDLVKQRANDTVRKSLPGKFELVSYELNPFNITLMEIIRLFWREGKHGN